MDRAWLGIDVGTQSVKAELFDEAGGSLGAGTAPLASHRQEGLHTQDPRQWISATEIAVALAVGKMLEGGDAIVTGVAVSATSGSLAVLDTRGRPVSEGLMYDDSRGSLYGEQVREGGSALWQSLGYPMADSWALPKICALPRLGFSPGATVGQQADVITSWLAGHRVASDSSHALKSGYDPLTAAWPAAVLETLGLDPSIFPPVVPSGTILGSIDAVIADRLGLPPGVPIVAGMTDGCGSQIASGNLRHGAWTSTIGTTLVLKGVTPNLIGDRSRGVYSHAAPFGDWLVGGASNVGANVVSSMLHSEDLSGLEETIPGLETLPLMYPLEGNGERFPFSSDKAEGFFVDGEVERQLSEWDRDKSTLFGGLMLGIALVEGLCFDTMKDLGAPVTETVSLSGGATSNQWWNQLRSDILRRSVSVSPSSGAAKGAAIIAASAITGRLRQMPEVAAEMSSPGQRFDPTSERSGLLADRKGDLLSRLHSREYITKTGYPSTGVAR